MKRLLRPCINSVPLIFKRAMPCGTDPYPGISREVLVKLETAYEKLREAKTNCLLKKHLDPKTLHRLKQIKTPTFTSNILDCVRCGLKYNDCRIGVYAPDVESYKVFGRLFNPLIEELHSYNPANYHPKENFGDVQAFEDIDPRHCFIYSTRIRVVRNLCCYPFAPKMTENDYKKIEEEIVHTLLALTGDLKGWYLTQADQFRANQVDWIENHLFKDPDRFMEAGKICRFLPTGRGFFHNLMRTFSVWVNYEDHLRVVSMQQGADFGHVYKRLVNAMRMFNVCHDFCHDPHLGYLTCSPENLGTGFRVSILIKLIKLPTDPARFQSVLSKHGLQVRGTYGRNTPIVGCAYDISNKRTLGINEFDSVKRVYEGAKEMMDLERCMKVKCNCDAS